MANTNEMFQQITDKIAAFLAKTVKALRKADRRMLIMAGSACALVIVILALIIHGVSSSNDVKEPVQSAPVQNIEVISTEEYEEPVQIDGAGKYRVDTGSAASLNMRLAADREATVVTKIPNGTELDVFFIDDIGVADGEFGWGYVEYDGEKGWVYMEYLAK